MINKIIEEDVTNFRFEVNMCLVGADAINLMDRYQQVATKSAIYPGQGSFAGLSYVGLKVNGEAGEFAEHVGKAWRDDNGSVTVERKEFLIKEIGDVLWYLSAACNELGIKLSEAAETNLNKLYDRTERGKLRGSGDDR